MDTVLSVSNCRWVSADHVRVLELQIGRYSTDDRS